MGSDPRDAAIVVLFAADAADAAVEPADCVSTAAAKSSVSIGGTENRELEFAAKGGEFILVSGCTAVAGMGVGWIRSGLAAAIEGILC